MSDSVPPYDHAMTWLAEHQPEAFAAYRAAPDGMAGEVWADAESVEGEQP